MGESFTIQISSNLVKQLANDGEKLRKKPKKPKAKPPREKPQIKPEQNQISADSGKTIKPNTAQGWPLQPPMFLPIPPPPQTTNPELEAIRSVLQESEKTVERLQKQEGGMLKEVTQRAKELHDKEFRLPFQKPMPCLAEKNACFDCYKEHVKDPLKCAPFVKSFEDCARRVRQQMSSHKVAANP